MPTPGDEFLLRQAIATLRRHVPGVYPALERSLSEARAEVIRDFSRLMREWESKLSCAERKVRQPWLG